MRLIRFQRPEVWSAFDQLSNLRQEINRFFEVPGSAAASEVFNSWSPSVDLYEDKDKLVVKVEVPGFNKEDIDISLHEGALTISGERKEERVEGSRTTRSERFYGRFQRTFTLPRLVNASKVAAAYKDGILTVTLPKAEEAKPRQIEVSIK